MAEKTTTVVVFMRNGFSDKDLQRILRLSAPSKASQAINPALDKLARCWLASPDVTLRMIQDRADSLRQQPDAPLTPQRL